MVETVLEHSSDDGQDDFDSSANVWTNLSTRLSNASGDSKLVRNAEDQGQSNGTSQALIVDGGDKGGHDPLDPAMMAMPTTTTQTQSNVPRTN